MPKAKQTGWVLNPSFSKVTPYLKSRWFFHTSILTSFFQVAILQPESAFTIHLSPQPRVDIPQQPLILPPSTTRHFPTAWDWGEMNAAKANTDVTQHVVLLERWPGWRWVTGCRRERSVRGFEPPTHPNNGHSLIHFIYLYIWSYM